MNSRWAKHDYEFVSTADGSPTVKWLKGEKGYLGEPETMHHLGGAYSETQVLYGDILRKSFDDGARSVISVGLGLGYLEILIAHEAVLRGLAANTVRTLSFESDPFLVEQFLKWVRNETDADPVYSEIYSFFKSDQNISMSQVQKWLLDQWASGSLKLGGSLGASTTWTEQYDCIFYDAFSAKTSPELWDEVFLTDLLGKACSPQSIVSTYACRGSMKRALRANGFELRTRDGVHSTRKSTLGSRISRP